jgi:hypothetical protein
MRRDTIGQHVRSKHTIDIAERLLKEYEEYDGKSDNHSTLQKIIKSIDAKNIPLHPVFTGYAGGRFFLLKPIEEFLVDAVETAVTEDHDDVALAGEGLQFINN